MPTLGFSSAPPEWAEKREAHYQQWFGPISLVAHEMPPFIPHIDVCVHPPALELGRNFYTFVTSGMSDERMHLDPRAPESLARAELIVYAQDYEGQAGGIRQPWYLNYMRFLAHFPFEQETWFGLGHTMPNGAPPAPFVDDSELTTVLFLPPLHESSGFAQGLKLNGEPVNFLRMALITTDECEYKLKYGYERLLERFGEVGFPRLLDVQRKSVLRARYQ